MYFAGNGKLNQQVVYTVTTNSTKIQQKEDYNFKLVCPAYVVLQVLGSRSALISAVCKARYKRCQTADKTECAGIMISLKMKRRFRVAKPMIHIRALGSKNNSEDRTWKKEQFFPTWTAPDSRVGCRMDMSISVHDIQPSSRKMGWFGGWFWGPLCQDWVWMSSSYQAGETVWCRVIICLGGNQRHGKVEGVGTVHPSLQKFFWCLSTQKLCCKGSKIWLEKSDSFGKIKKLQTGVRVSKAVGITHCMTAKHHCHKSCGAVQSALDIHRHSSDRVSSTDL